MKKKCLTILLFVMCIGFIIPMSVHAISYQYVDYRFTMVDEDGNNIKGLNFELYDKNDIFHFESQYNEEEDYYYINYSYYNDITTAFPSEIINFEISNYQGINECDSYVQNFSNIIDNNPRFSIGDNVCVLRINDHNNYYYDYTFSASAVIPLILEEKNTHSKKIVFGSLHYNYNIIERPYKYYDFSLVNTDINSSKSCIQELHVRPCQFYYEEINNQYVKNYENISFTRSIIYNYTDELWEELNNGPIASSELTVDSSVLLNETDSTNFNEPATMRLNPIKDDDNQENNNSSIINPYTFNNGIFILVVSLIIILFGTSLFIRKKYNN